PSYTDIGGGIAKCKITNEPFTLGHTKLERDFVPLIVEGAAAIDACRDLDRRPIKFRARERVDAGRATCDQHRAVRQESCRMVVSRLVQAAGDRPSTGGRVIEFGTRASVATESACG